MLQHYHFDSNFPGLFDGEDNATGLLEIYGTIQDFNRAVYEAHPKWRRIGIINGVSAYVNLNEDLHYAGRDFGLLLLQNMEKLVSWVQPIYRSSGWATPELNTQGKWLPTAGLLTSEGRRVRYTPSARIGWITKHFYSPKTEKWIRHDKTEASIPPVLVKILKSV